MKVNISKYPDWDAEKQEYDSIRVKDVHIDDFDVWSMDNTLAMIIVPMLEELKRQHQGAPCLERKDVPSHLISMEESDDWDNSEFDFNIFKTWENILNEMIWVFTRIRENDVLEIHTSEVEVEGFKKTEANFLGFENDAFWTNEEAIERDYERIQKGCEMFGKFFQNLWD